MPEQTAKSMNRWLNQLLLWLVIVGVLLLLTILGTAWWGQHSRCEGSNAIRAVALKRASADYRRAEIFRKKGEFELAANAAETAKASAGLKILHCDQLLPPE